MSKTAKHPVSLVIITLNEEANIKRCIESVPWAQDIVVLDSGSSDRTVEIAKELGARTFVEEWRGYRDQKARATELAEHDWVVSLDADEALSPELSEELQALLTNGCECDGYESPRISFYLGRWIRHGGWYPDKQIRFFNRQKCAWSEGHVHERVKGEKIGQVRHPIRHWPFVDLKAQVQTNNEYSSLAAQDLSQRNKSFSLIMMMFKPFSKFIETYLLKLGFLDGRAGLIISVGAAYSMFLKWAKLGELNGEFDGPSKSSSISSGQISSRQSSSSQSSIANESN